MTTCIDCRADDVQRVVLGKRSQFNPETDQFVGGEAVAEYSLCCCQDCGQTWIDECVLTGDHDSPIHLFPVTCDKVLALLRIEVLEHHI